MSSSRVGILADPNGAGKSTGAKYLLTEKYFIYEFVNADAVATGLTAFAPHDLVVNESFVYDNSELKTPGAGGS